MKKIVVLNLLFVWFSIESRSQITFQKTITGEGYDSYGKAVVISNDGGFITCTAIDYASTASSGQVGLSLNKFDTNGILIWSKNISDSEKIIPRDIKQTNTGGYIIAGETSNSGSNPSAYLLKTDSIGNFIWCKKFQTNAGHGYSVVIANDGGYVLTGSSILGVYIVKTDSSGNHIWSKQIREAIVNNDMQGMSIDNTFDGGYIVGGMRCVFAGSPNDFLLMKFDSLGNLLWTKIYNIVDEWAYCVKETNDNGFIITGYSYYGSFKRILLIKTDSFGNPTWSRGYGVDYTDNAEYIEQTSDGGYCIIGTSISSSTGDFGMYLLKLDSLGTVVWSKTYGGSTYEFGFCLKQTSDNGYILIGSTRSFSSVFGYRDTYFIKTDSLGNSLCYENDVITITDTLNPTASLIFPNVTIMSDGTFSTASYSGYLNDTTICYSLSVTENINNNTLQIYPNPTTGKLYFSNINKTCFIEIFDIYGKIILTDKINKEHFEINLNNNTKGIYFYRVTEENKKFHTGKIVLN